MSLYETSSREYRHVTRVWFRCDECELRGDFTATKGAEAAVLRDLAGMHDTDHRRTA